MGFTKEFNRLVTEERNSKTEDLDLLETLALVKKVQSEDFAVAEAVEKVTPEIAKAVDVIVTRLRAGGRMLYFGAGTSGRLGVLDATECSPTFGVDFEQVQAFIAGGNEAMFRAFENCEDSTEAGVVDARAANVKETDVVIGITASGRTPYVVGALKYAKEVGATTIGIINNTTGLESVCDIIIAAITGPEALTGSTRMKAGSAQKMVLNLISTCTMVRLGKVYENLMVDLRPSNEKLRERAVSIISILGDVPRHIAEGSLVASQNRAKTAILMLKRKIGRAQAEELLTKCEGSLRKALLTSV
jgi:N-acetylmuramic acid 6-phosphate etherase